MASSVDRLSIGTFGLTNARRTPEGSWTARAAAASSTSTDAAACKPSAIWSLLIIVGSVAFGSGAIPMAEFAALTMFSAPLSFSGNPRAFLMARTSLSIVQPVLVCRGVRVWRVTPEGCARGVLRPRGASVACWGRACARAVSARGAFP